ncbi:hypothetical protein B5C34_13465 [Pacificimonas flava]|uniref:HTH tetR-type domain-containing protein n=1 Tax=Pacificimonas flava TaxID=1234595 RepID=A0A219B7N4_9SPHN|nr:hypothetical protein B5C34_13465 [Pacificimonas flava]
MQGAEADTRRTGRRKRSEDRISEIVDLAERQIRDHATVELSMNDISGALGVSRALIYAYFEDQNALIDSVLKRELDRLASAGLLACAEESNILSAAGDAALIYMRHVATHGPTLHIILREVPHTSLVLGQLVRRNLMLGRFARRLHRSYHMAIREAIVAVEMLSAVPEELGRQLGRGELSPADADVTCRRLVEASLLSIRPVAAFRS